MVDEFLSDVDGIDLPCGPVFAANSRVYSPVPAPTSAMAMPSLMPHASTASFRLS